MSNEESFVKSIAVSGNELVVNFNDYVCHLCGEVVKPEPISYKFGSSEEAYKTYEAMIK